MAAKNWKLEDGWVRVKLKKMHFVFRIHFQFHFYILPEPRGQNIKNTNTAAYNLDCLAKKNNKRTNLNAGGI